jgi:colanic acid/amylovoran biosynthesis glycosyltransferase
MKLAVFTTQFPGKVSVFFSRDMRALIEAGIEVDVFPIYPHDRSMWTYVPELLNERVLPRNRVHHINLREVLRSLSPQQLRRARGLIPDAAAVSSAGARAGVGPLSKSLYVVPLAMAWANRYGSTYDYVFSYWGNYAATCAYLAHKWAGRPIPFSFQLHAGADLYFNKVFLRQKLLYADSIVTVCEFNKRYIQEQFGDIYQRIESKITINYMGVDLADFPYMPEGRNPRRVLGIGRFVDTKGYDYLLRAIAELVTRGVDVELELVGDGLEAHSLRALAAQLGIAERVIFRGWLKSDEVQAALRQSAVFVHPSSGLGDAKPNVIEEAMAVGTPVVATAVSGIPELLDHGRCGMLVAPRDVQQMASAIQQLLAEPSLRHRFAEKARHFTEEHLDLWKNGARLADHFRSVQRDKQEQSTKLPGGNLHPEALHAGLAELV